MEGRRELLVLALPWKEEQRGRTPKEMLHPLQDQLHK
jgi:hypothetical protein